MARRRSYGRGRSFGSGLGKPLIPLSGMLAGAALGIAGAALAARLPQIIPFQRQVAGYALGGVAGLAGSLAHDALGKQDGGQSGGFTGL